VAGFDDLIGKYLAERRTRSSDVADALRYDRAYLSRVGKGVQDPSAALAAALDAHFGTCEFSMLLAQRREAAARSASRVDPAEVAALRETLDATRLLDDAIGSAEVRPSAALHLRQVTRRVGEARGPHRDAMVDVAAAWAVFAGWVDTALGRWSSAETALGRAWEWSAEVADDTLVSVALSFRAYLALNRGRYGSALGLATAAGRIGAAHPAQQAYTVLQRARVYTELGDRDAARAMLDGADAAIDRATAEGAPPAPIYWNASPFFRLHAGRTLLKLGDAADAAAFLESGLAALPDAQSAAEWTQKYRGTLAEARAAL
jgi:tetratricopeptide (TPR) repeat protein